MVGSMNICLNDIKALPSYLSLFNTFKESFSCHINNSCSIIIPYIDTCRANIRFKLEYSV